MDIELFKLAIIGLVFLVAGFVNYTAVSMADARKSRLGVAAVVFGAGGILLMAIVIFWPLIALIIYIADDAANVVALFKPLLIAAACCTLGAAALLAIKVCTARRLTGSE